MKRSVLIAAFALLSTLCFPLSVQAVSVPGGTVSNPSPPSGDSSDPEPSEPEPGVDAPFDGEWSEDGSVEGDVHLPYPNYTVYQPKVTSLKSANALMADSGEAVYFLPSLEDFPTDLTDTVTDLTDGNGVRHRFAIVYDGYFDSDVAYVAATPLNDTSLPNARITTSKKVYSMEYNSRLCTLLGYDLLLRNEKITMDSTTTKGVIQMYYNATKINDSILDTQIMIMDLYKALGIYEWDIEFAYGFDPDFDANTSPILQQLGVLTTSENQGLNTDESYVWVAATRTNPDLYWNRCQKDLIFDGGAHMYEGAYWGNEVSVSGTFAKTSTPTFGEFCAMARALMSLYGEPVLTAQEIKDCQQYYGLYLPETSFAPDIYQSLVYLTAKGILDPRGKDFNSVCTFDDIEEILLRIADDDSRLSIEPPSWNPLQDKGFSQVDDLVMMNSGVSYYEMNSDALPYYDYLIEMTPGVTEYLTYARKPDVSKTYGSQNTTTDPTIQRDNVKLLSSTYINSVTSEDPESSEAALSTTGLSVGYLYGDNEETQQLYGAGIQWLPDSMIRNMGIVTYDEKQYYHIQLKLNVGFGGVASISPEENVIIPTSSLQLVFTYKTTVDGDLVVRQDPNTLVEREQSEADKIPYIMINQGAGIYHVSANKSVSYQSFRDGGFDHTMRDAETEMFNRVGLTTYTASNTLIAVSVPMDNGFNSATLAELGSNFSAETWNNVFAATGIVDMNDGGVTKAFAQHVDSGSKTYLRIEFYCTDGGTHVKNDNCYRALTGGEKSSDNAGFYRAEDGTLLVNVDDLLSRGQLASFKTINEDTYQIVVRGDGEKSLPTNVTIHYKEGSTSNFICVGNTVFPAKSFGSDNAILLEKLAGGTYINYMAFTGWASNIVLTPMSEEGQVYAYTPTIFDRVNDGWNAGSIDIGDNLDRMLTNQGTTINLLLPQTTLTTNTMSVYINTPTSSNAYSHTRYRGVPMLASYPLADYIIVKGEPDAITHTAPYYLFTYHIRGLQGADTEDVMDDSAREKLASLLNINIPERSDTYFLNCVQLDQTSRAGFSNLAKGSPTDQSGFLFAQQKFNSLYGPVTLDYGWIYVPTEYTSVKVACQAWDEHPYSDDASVLNEMPISLFLYNGKYYDANLNHCESAIDGIMPTGVLPGYFLGKDYGTTSLKADGSFQAPTDQSVDATQFSVIPAPVGQFAYFTAGTKEKIANIGNNPIFWGTSRVYYAKSDNELRTTARCGLIGKADEVDIVKTFTAMLGQNIYVIQNDSIVIGDLLSEATNNFGIQVFENVPKVDWDKYSFNRLIQSVDNWSSILLIFILNILPRVCMMFFFVLLIFSLIADVPLWQAFCHNVFDVYKLLTLGHQTVDTIRMKQLFIQSLICLIFFWMIMDGTLLEIIEFILRWMTTLTNY